MAEEELKMEEGGKKKKLIIIIIAAVVLLAGGGAAAYFLLGDSQEVTTEVVEGEAESTEEATASAPSQTGSALYVAMPRPFVFNVPGSTRDRLVEIKVQLMLRGYDNEEQIKMHIPSIEGALLRVFSTANADDLVTEAGKIAIRDSALKEVQKKMQEITGKQLVEEVLFTGFVMQ
ncbi:MAG: flagellar basal body-associated protein FliL [Paraglaciecola sp.]|uniref:flagellar basal body-associated protein FliL n=1 Tax=Paraglaciecola sp. TaxID=1920173 RepID=UPI00273E0587|nr:flagellar basal body-associated protein FliL [Paraglaciecola sp.]MDP5032736.1 flagellar basal body-associated protein FliL [Paraglaciecola sp.]MDP5039379.1 flagellar basal body-associated protein FliL [Paraglaciecola sp.]MDP5132217.1 flagellar basal body-associated protein FliL [Paraglaciecola sp.]